ncbi:hypothetical protein LB503_003433 [Fusarium chuoi]|nr:hypothetical protein LB503_003433 [Fusarium chuoi]
MASGKEEGVAKVNQGLCQVSADPGYSHETSNSSETPPDKLLSVALSSPTSRWPEEIARNIIHAQKNNSNLERTVFVPLPPKEHIMHFIPYALEDMYEAESLFSTDNLLKLLNDQYSAGLSNCHANPTRWATMNALIATDIHWKADNKAIKELFPMSWAYFKNSFAIFPEIVMNGNGIDSCQAMIAMALFMRGTADARAFTALLSAAAHAIQCNGLHLEDPHGPSDLIDMERPREPQCLCYNVYLSDRWPLYGKSSAIRHSEVTLNVEWIGKFAMFLQNFQDREECDLSGLIEFCSKLYDIASFAQRNATDLVNGSEDNTEELWRQYTDLRVRLLASHDPMLLAQGLLTNMPLLGAKSTEVFSGIVTEDREDGFTRLVPTVLKPSSFNFFAKQ